MIFAEPKLEFVRIDMQDILTTSGQGGSGCFGNEPECGDTAKNTCSYQYQAGPRYDV